MMLLANIGYQEILVVFVVVLLIFGARRIPEIARAFGRASFEFKKAKEGIARESEELARAAEERAAAESAAGTEKPADPAAGTPKEG